MPSEAIKLLNKELKKARKELEIIMKEKPDWCFSDDDWAYREQKQAVAKSRVGTLIYVRGLIKKNLTK